MSDPSDRRSWSEFFASLCGCGRNVDSETFAVPTPHGPVTATRTTSSKDPFHSKNAVPVSAEEVARLRTQGGEATAFHFEYRGPVESPTLRDLDAAFLEWQRRKNPPHDARQVIDILGAAFGNRCVDDFDMEWVTFDVDGESVYGVKSRAIEATIFPFDAVRKRIESREHRFLDPIYRVLQERLASGEYAPRKNRS